VRRAPGFASIVQATAAFARAEGEAAGIAGPMLLPARALGRASGALMARQRQAQEGGSWQVPVSVAQTASWLWELGRVAHGLAYPEIGPEAVETLLEMSDSAFGRLRAVRHAAQLSETPARGDRPDVPFGTHAPRGDVATR